MIDLNSLILVYLPRVALVLFVLLISIAMMIYPGGTYRDPSTESYIFIENFLSDLGRWSAWNQEKNFYSSLLFSFAFLIVGLVFSIFFWILPSLFLKENFHLATKIGSGAGIISGIFIIGISLTPADIAYTSHIFFSTWFMRFFLIAAFCYTLVFSKSEFMESKYALGYAIFSILIASYILILEFGPSIQESLWALRIQVLSQKLICLSFIISVAFQTIGNKKVYNIHNRL
tara:strand:+ start:5277 stop:5969 length:693 start_codon:yes stop_codon:yes gene_type:complete